MSSELQVRKQEGMKNTKNMELENVFYAKLKGKEKGRNGTFSVLYLIPITILVRQNISSD